MDNRAGEMEAIENEVRNLTISPLYAYRQQNRYSHVFGEGDLNAEIVFIGEAPGAQEAKTGRPFVGASGKVLSELLNSVGLQREDVYITNIVKDRPPENRDPNPEEIRLYAPFLKRQIDIIRPNVIATLGRFSMDFILDLFQMPQQGGKISALHGQLLKADASYGPVWILPLFHPAVALYDQNKRDVLRQDFSVLKTVISREPEG